MHARRTLTKGSPDRIEDAKRIIKDTTVPMVQELPGFLGGYWLADPKTGEGLSVTFFDSKEALEATAQKAGEIRTATTQKIGGLEVLGVEHLEVIASTGDKVHRSALAARVINFENDPAKVEEGIKNFNENVIPGVIKIPGFQGGFWAVNRSTGKGFGVTLYDTPASVEASREASKQLRERTAQTTGATVSEPREYEVIGRALATAGTPG